MEFAPYSPTLTYSKNDKKTLKKYIKNLYPSCITFGKSMFRIHEFAGCFDVFRPQKSVNGDPPSRDPPKSANIYGFAQKRPPKKPPKSCFCMKIDDPDDAYPLFQGGRLGSGYSFLTGRQSSPPGLRPRDPHFRGTPWFWHFLSLFDVFLMFFDDFYDFQDPQF